MSISLSKAALEEQRRLMGITSRGSDPPVILAPGHYVVDDGKPPLTERRSLTLFKGVSEMTKALDRAHHLVARVNATIQSSRQASTRSQVNEKNRAFRFRLDQEIGNALDTIHSAKDALEELDRAEKAAKREARRR